MIFGAEQLCQKMAFEKCALIFAKSEFFEFFSVVRVRRLPCVRKIFFENLNFA